MTYDIGFVFAEIGEAGVLGGKVFRIEYLALIEGSERSAR